MAVVPVKAVPGTEKAILPVALAATADAKAPINSVVSKTPF
jgi:hypothetical protein